MDLFNLFPDLRIARACFEQKNYEICCEIYSELLEKAKESKNSPLLCVIYLEYCEALIRGCECYFIDEIRDISNSKVININKKEDDLEIAWDLLELSRSVFMTKQDIGCRTNNIKKNNGKCNKNITTNDTKDIVDLDDNAYITKCLAQSYFLLAEIQLLNNDFLGAISDYSNCMVELEKINNTKTIKFCEALYKTATCNEFMNYYEEAIKLIHKMIGIYKECSELDDTKREVLVNELNDRICEIEYKQNKQEGVKVANEDTKDEKQENVPVLNINSLKKKKTDKNK
ncbi:hypothetical protein BDAP_002079 [Binucleata daphniae]